VLSLRELNRVERSGICLLKKKQIAAFIDDTIVTSTFCFLASASAAATMVLIGGQIQNISGWGRSADDGAATEARCRDRLSITTSILNMRRMLPHRGIQFPGFSFPVS